MWLKKFNGRFLVTDFDITTLSLLQATSTTEGTNSQVKNKSPAIPSMDIMHSSVSNANAQLGDMLLRSVDKLKNNWNQTFQHIWKQTKTGLGIIRLY